MDEHNGPDQVLPATATSTTIANGRVKLCIEQSGTASTDPISIPGLLRRTAQNYPDVPALAFKGEDKAWKFITYSEYEKTVRMCAKAFLRLGLQRHHSVCIIGFNAPEWFFSSLGAIYAGGFSTGLYTTNSADACQYCAEKCRANIIVVENKEQLDKILKIKDSLKDLKAIVQYHGAPEAEGVISWTELLKIGEDAADKELDDVMKTMCINECCSVLFTSGTVGKPKAAMVSHDNITWNAIVTADYLQLQNGKEVFVSYLPLNHIAGQLLDMYITMVTASTVYFADTDALKGTLLNTLQEARPTQFFGVPRVWEKICEKMQKVTAESGKMKGMIASWAKHQGLQHYIDKMNGTDSNTFSYLLARMLVFSKIKQALGLDRCRHFFAGAAPISIDTKKFFMSIDIPLQEVYGMTESTGTHVLGDLATYNYETIGQDKPGIYTKIANPDKDGNGEVCMKGRHVFMGYLNEPEKTAETLQDNWLHSGDIGKLDENGFLVITGRIKELVITAGGENIAPVLIEEEVKKELPCIRNAMVVGDRRKYLTILLTMKTEVNIQTGEPLDELTPETKQWCTEVGCEANTVKDVLNGSNEKLMAAIKKGINEANTRAISNAHRVQKFAILPHDFSIPTGELGPTMKLMRNIVAKKYEATIERLYQEP